MIKQILILLTLLLILSCGGDDTPPSYDDLSFHELTLDSADIANIETVLRENGCTLDSTTPYSSYMIYDTVSYGYSKNEVYYLRLPSPKSTTLSITTSMNTLHGFAGIVTPGNRLVDSVEITLDTLIYLKRLALINEQITAVGDWVKHLRISELDIRLSPVDTLSDLLMTSLDTPAVFTHTSDTLRISDTLGRWMNLHASLPYESTVYPILDSTDTDLVRKILRENGIDVPDAEFVEPYLNFLGTDGGFYNQFTLPFPVEGRDSLVLTDHFSALSEKYRGMTIPGSENSAGPIKRVVIHTDSVLILPSLDLSHQQLTALPEGVDLLRTESLDLSFNRIDTISEDIMGLTRYPLIYRAPRVNLTGNPIDTAAHSYLLKEWLETYAGVRW